MNKGTEHQEQCAYFDWVRLKAQSDYRYNLIWAIPNGAKLGRDPRLAAIQMHKLKAEGFKNGVPDIIIAYPIPQEQGFASPGAFIEMKVGRNKPSPEQVKLIRELRDVGYLIAVCYNSLEAISFTVKYFNQEKRCVDI